MKELNPKELEMVNGGMKWQGREKSMNIVDSRTGYAHTPFLSPNFYVPNPIEHYKSTGKILPDRWSDIYFGRP